MRNALPRLRDKLAEDPVYFRKVYIHTFDFARVEGQRSLGANGSAFFIVRDFVPEIIVRESRGIGPGVLGFASTSWVEGWGVGTHQGWGWGGC